VARFSTITFAVIKKNYSKMKKQTASSNNGNSRRNVNSAPKDRNNTNCNPPQELYQNLVTDYGFKTVFTKKHFLISFLNEILQGHEKIKSIEYAVHRFYLRIITMLIPTRELRLRRFFLLARHSQNKFCLCSRFVRVS
jgi:hypothetical protein